MYNNSIYIFDKNNIEVNILFLKFKEFYPDYSDDQINSFVNIYFSKKYLGCTYSSKIENQINNMFKFIKKNQ